MPRQDYRIIDTDYTQYAVVYNCEDVLFGAFHYDIAWILSRKQTLQPAVMNKLK